LKVLSVGENIDKSKTSLIHFARQSHGVPKQWRKHACPLLSLKNRPPRIHCITWSTWTNC